MLGNNDYILMPLAYDELDAFMKKRDFLGINITIPYKERVMPYCDYISDEARKINSVNTIVNRDGKLYGYNTDYFGFSYMCEIAGISFTNKKVVILGSGGTSLTSQAVVKDCGASEIIVVSRTGENNYDNISLHKDCDVVINTTPIGMFPNNNNAPINLKEFSNLSGVVDVIYNPLKTELLLAAKEMKIKNTCGLIMLVAQAIKADSLFFDKQPDELCIMDIKEKMEQAVSNIVLVGMPGCGKSTIGKLLAQKLNMAFVDTDDEIELHTKMTIPQIFEQYGEAYFRKLEQDAIKDICKNKRQVISTGGGSIIDQQNCRELSYNSKVIWLDRDINLLETRGRPLSKDKEHLTRLYEQRMPIFKKISDIQIVVEGEPLEVLNKILEYLR